MHDTQMPNCVPQDIYKPDDYYDDLDNEEYLRLDLYNLDEPEPSEDDFDNKLWMKN